MSEGVVDLLEVVEVDDEQGESRLVSGTLLDALLQAVE